MAAQPQVPRAGLRERTRLGLSGPDGPSSRRGGEPVPRAGGRSSDNGLLHAPGFAATGPISYKRRKIEGIST
jgi:hypothetical protein